MKEKYLKELKEKLQVEVKKTIKESNENRERELEMFESALLTPIRNIIMLGNKVLKNEVPVSYYTNSSMSLSSYIKEFLSRGRK